MRFLSEKTANRVEEEGSEDCLIWIRRKSSPKLDAAVRKARQGAIYRPTFPSLREDAA